MRKILPLLIFFVVLGPLPAGAGLIHGSIHEGKVPAGKRQIAIVCSKEAPPITAETDDRGDYRVFVDARGPCKMRVGESEPATIFSSDDPVRYDFEIESGKGPALLRRR